MTRKEIAKITGGGISTTGNSAMKLLIQGDIKMRVVKKLYKRNGWAENREFKTYARTHEYKYVN